MRSARAIAIILTGLSLVPSGAHLFELPHKITLQEEQYFVVQQIYRGWALFGVVIIAAFVANLVLAILLRRRGLPAILPTLACVAIAGSLAVFFLWVYPGNVATDNWTRVPADWQALRMRWEFGHAAGALLMFLALCAVSFTATGSDHPVGAQRPQL